MYDSFIYLIIWLPIIFSIIIGFWLSRNKEMKILENNKYNYKKNIFIIIFSAIFWVVLFNFWMEFFKLNDILSININIWIVYFFLKYLFLWKKINIKKKIILSSIFPIVMILIPFIVILFTDWLRMNH